MNLYNFAMGILQTNPQVANNPRAKELIQVLQSGDTEKGQRIAQNICDSYGITKEQALSQARQHFGIPFENK